MDTNAMKDIENAIKIVRSLEEAKKIAEADAEDAYRLLLKETDPADRLGYAERMLKAYKVIDIIRTIVSTWPMDDGNIYSGLYNLDY